MNGPIAYLRIGLFHLSVLLALSAGDATAVQIEPNPNPDGNTITITPSTPRENLVPFTNVGVINIQPSASFSNQSRLENFGGGFVGGWIINSGTITNSDVFINNRIVSLEVGSQFINLPSGLYDNLHPGHIQIQGTFVNEGTVKHGLGYIRVSESGQYIQRQAVGSSVTPTTITPDAPFTNAGRVHIAAGDFIIDPISIRSASATYDQSSTGTTQIDGRLQSIGGTVRNAGAITIGSTGEYRQQSSSPSPSFAGSTINSGTFTNAGMTNINTGVFENSGSFRSDAGQVRIGEGTSFSNFSSHELPVAQYVQQAGGTTQIDGTFQNNGARVENAGSMTVGSTGTYTQAFNKFVGVESTTVNTGTFTNGGSTSINTGTFTNQGSLVNSGTLEVGVVGPGAVINHGGMVNSGTFEVAALGQITGTGSYVQTAAAAQTIVNGTFAHNVTLQAGALTGTGTIQGTVQNSGGLLLPGNNGLGTLTIKGQYAQGFGGTFGVNLAGLSQGVTYGLLAVQGTGAAVTLGGSLKVGLLNGFSPSLGNTFGVLTCTGCTISGGLRSLSLPTLASGLDWSVRFVDGLGTLQLAVVSTPTASAPEPTTLLLVGSGFVGLAGWRRRQTKARSAQTVSS